MTRDLPTIVDFGILLGIALGYIGVFLAGAVVLTRMALGVRDFLNRNN